MARLTFSQATEIASFAGAYAQERYGVCVYVPTYWVRQRSFGRRRISRHPVWSILGGLVLGLAIASGNLLLDSSPDARPRQAAAIHEATSAKPAALHYAPTLSKR